MSNIIDLSAKTDDATFRSPKQCLEECLADLGKHGAFEHGTKLLVLVLDDSDGQYNTNFAQAGMKMSECVALCEVSKTVFLAEMGYPHQE